MEEKYKVDSVEEDNREVALGICFGCGLGTMAGAIFGNVAMGLSAGGVLGILIGVAAGSIRKFKTR